jgi:subtilisin family serine protease
MSDFIPQKGRFISFTDSKKHFIAQFYQIPPAKQRRTLNAKGLTLKRYIGGHSYVVTCSNAQVFNTNARGLKQVLRAVVDITPQMKIPSTFVSNAYLKKQMESGVSHRYAVRFYDDVSLERALQVIRQAGIDVKDRQFSYSHFLVLDATWEEMNVLLGYDEVERLEPGAPGVKLANSRAAQLSNVHRVREKQAFAGADGSSVIVGVWDASRLGQHVDFEDRVIHGEENYLRWDGLHVTVVCGTLAGAGILDENAKGMAPKAKLVIYDLFNFPSSSSSSATPPSAPLIFLDPNYKPFNEMNEAIEKYGIMMTNNSWAIYSGWDWVRDYYSEEPAYYLIWCGDWQFGYYGHLNFDADQLIRNTDLLVVFAASNDRENAFLGPHRHSLESEQLCDQLHPPDGDYKSIPFTANAKNLLTVGAVMDDGIITGFSSWGPTNDGRVKPDVVANGYEMLTTWPGNTYVSENMSGTSLSTPVVTGTAALLLDYYHRIKGTTTGASMLKNLLIHSARDAGNPGPDYAYGYGIVDAELAAKIIKNDGPTKALMIEDSLDHNDTKRYTFDVPEGTKELRATLVWHDVPNETLVNDLDLWLEQGEDNIVLPFVLDPENPSALAVRGQNTRDNVEYIRAANPRAGRWEIGVRGSSVPGGPQKYSLIVSASDGNAKPITKNEGNFTLRRVWATNNTTNYNPVTTFHYGDNLHLISEFIVTENVDYGGWWGTISELWQVIDPQGNDIIRVTLTGDRFAPGNTPYYSGIVRDFIIPRTLPAGTYTVKVTMTMHNGFSQSAESQFIVTRKIYPLNF